MTLWTRAWWGLAWAAPAALLLCTALPAAASPRTPPQGGVLFISSFSPTIPWTEAMLGTIKDKLAQDEAAAAERPINLYVEFLDRSRLPDRPSNAQWADLLATKYRDVQPQAVIADGAPAIELVAKFGRHFAGNAPMIGIFPNFNDLPALADAVSVKVTTGPHIEQTVDMALAHWPDARKLVIVSDNTELSHHLAQVIRGALDRRADAGVEVEHLFDLRLEDLETTLAARSRDSVVIYTHLAIDNTGRQFRPNDVVARMAKVSGAPIYVLFDGDIGTGAIGGYVNDPHLAGQVAARAALNLLGKGHAHAASAGNHYSSLAAFDWRQLRRWGIDERTLPPDAEIRFRQPSVIEAYFWEAVVGLAFIGVLSAVLVLLSILFMQRGRHARALRETNSRLEDRVAARTRDIEQALSGEQVARRRLRTFLDMATHEFKTPLAVIDSSAQMLELLVDTEREGVGSRLTLIRGSVRRVIDLIETCLAGDRVDDDLPVRFTEFAPAALVQSVAERQRGHGAVLVADVSRLPETCVADRDLLGIALDMLLDNARRYGPADTPIEVTAWREAWQDGASMVIAVGDRGPGISRDEAKRIFEKYYRGAHGLSTPGTGLGLHLVKTIAELHGGSIDHTERDGGGTVFRLTIPLVQTGSPAREKVEPARR